MNDNKISMIVRCIVNTNKKNISQLQNLISQKIKTRWTRAGAVLMSQEQYWKYEDNTDIVYGIYNDTPILVKDFISLFEVTWNYSCTTALNVNTQLNEDLEEALWSKNVHSHQEFLLEWADWVQVYSWK